LCRYKRAFNLESSCGHRAELTVD